MNPGEAYLPILEKLRETGAEFLLIGSLGLYLYHPEALREYPIRDCDLLTGPEPGHLGALGACLQGIGFELKLWDQVWHPGISQSELQGKWYLRAKKDDLQIDLTYECPWLGRGDALSRMNLIREVPVAAESDIWLLKRAKSEELAREFADRFGLSVL